MFVEEKDFKKVMKVFYEVNQIMKGIYKDETSFSPIYNMSYKKGLLNFYYYDENSLPVLTRFRMSDEVNEIFSFLGNETVQVTIDGKEFYGFLKDSRTSITGIQIGKNTIRFVGKKLIKETEELIENSYQLKLDENLFKKNFSYFSKEKDNLNPELMIDMNTMSEKVVKKLNDTKKMVPVIFDVESGDIFLDEDFNNENPYLKLYLNKKFINGLFYKVTTKKSKKDIEPKIEVKYSEINTKIYETSRDSVYLINLLVNNDLGILEHKFIVSDFELSSDISNS